MRPSFLLYIAIVFLLCSQQSSAQTPCVCCTKNHKAFDFWVGEWIVYDTIGNKIGENSIQKLEDQCLLNEHWKSVQGSTGSSYNYYNTTDSTWNQVWVDNKGGNLVLKGHASTNQMILKSEFHKGPTGNIYCNRITWTLNSDSSVTQRWDIADENDHLLSVAFIGVYRKK